MKISAVVIMAGLVGFVLTAVSGFLMIPWLRKLNYGRMTHDTVSKSVPTMGGLMTVLGVVVSVIVTAVTDKLSGGDISASGSLIPSEQYTKLWSGIITALCFGFIGFVDDWIRFVMHQNLGLTVRQKSTAQVLAALMYMVSMSLSMGGSPYMFIPFVGMLHMGIFYWICGIAVVYATVSAAEFTDGIDGLSALSTLTSAVTLGVIAAMKGFYGFSMVACALVGSCIGFLLWNRNPSKVFPGNTGAVFSGGMLVALAFGINCPLILIPACFVYVVEGISYVLQVVCYRNSGKKILKKAPLHRHLEMCGWSRNKIVFIFTIINVFGGVTAVALMYFGGYAG
ncbi:MAG: phospho-N-acetylmuramoyl-pentapeptide-transferase [Clostridia bacterium]|nr:phospho-N-acetylmuramoyl-pentapeptide-transferase [Clostridia bacterium]